MVIGVKLIFPIRFSVVILFSSPCQTNVTPPMVHRLGRVIPWSADALQNRLS